MAMVGRGRFRAASISTVVAVIATLVVGPAAPAQADPIDCPEVLPIEEVTEGLTGQGYTVAAGTTAAPFDAEVTGVLADGIAPGVDLIVAELASPELTDAGGVWAGMSGSPVYVDGQLMGAVAYGFSTGPSTLAGITPAEHLVELLNRGEVPAAADTEITVPPAMRRELAQQFDVSEQAVAALQPLPVPVAATGLAPQRRAELARRFERDGLNAIVVPGSSQGAADLGPEDITAAGNVAVAVSHGVATIAAIGTTTIVCGDRTVAFGHPFFFEGRVNMSLHPASAVDIARDPTLGPYKLANPGPPVGTVDIDSTLGVRGFVGRQPQSTPITSTVTNQTEGRTTTGRTDILFDDFLIDSVVAHLYTQWDVQANDDVFYSGTAQVEWSVSGNDNDGRPWTLTGADVVADDFDMSTAALTPLADDLFNLQQNTLEEIELTEIGYTGTATAGPQSARMLTDQIRVSIKGQPFQPIEDANLVLARGEEFRLQVPVRDFRGTRRVIEVTARMPFLRSGGFTLLISGGGSDSVCGFFPEECVDYGTASFGNILALLQDRYRSDELGVIIAKDVELNRPTATGTLNLAPAGAVLEGDYFGSVQSSGACVNAVQFADVPSSNPHRVAIRCAAGVGIVNGVSTNPPLFDPARAVTRGQASTMIARALEFSGYTLPAPAGNFTDIAGSPHADAIRRLYAAGIVQGVTATTFAPNAQIRRDQLASVLMRAYEWARMIDPYRPATAGYADVPASNVHSGAIATASTWGLISGRTATSFDPTAPARRDQMATLVMRMVDALPL